MSPCKPWKAGLGTTSGDLGTRTSLLVASRWRCTGLLQCQLNHPPTREHDVMLSAILKQINCIFSASLTCHTLRRWGREWSHCNHLETWCDQSDSWSYPHLWNIASVVMEYVAINCIPWQQVGSCSMPRSFLCTVWLARLIVSYFKQWNAWLWQYYNGLGGYRPGHTNNIRQVSCLNKTNIWQNSQLKTGGNSPHLFWFRHHHVNIILSKETSQWQNKSKFTPIVSSVICVQCKFLTKESIWYSI